MMLTIKNKIQLWWFPIFAVGVFNKSKKYCHICLGYFRITIIKGN
jgi:hypothetical protein